MLLLLSVALASPGSFTRDFAAALGRTFPECAAEAAGRLTVGVRCEGGDQLTLSLERVYGLCRASPADCPRERESFLRGFEEALHPAPVALDHVIPGIRPHAVVEGPNGAKVLYEPFVGDLVLVYLVDSPSTMRYLNRTELPELGVPAGDLLARTRPNVKGAAGELDVQQHGPLLWVTGSVYTSSILLEREFWERLAEKHGAVYAAAPARDLVLVLGTETADARAPELLRLAAAAILADPRTVGALSAAVLQWQAGGWIEVAAEGKEGR